MRPVMVAVLVVVLTGGCGKSSQRSESTSTQAGPPQAGAPEAGPLAGSPPAGSPQAGSPQAGSGYSDAERWYATYAMEYIKAATESDQTVALTMQSVSNRTTPLSQLKTELVAAESRQVEAWRHVPHEAPSRYSAAHDLLSRSRATRKEAAREFLLYFADEEPGHIALANAGMSRAADLLKSGIDALQAGADIGR